MEHEELIDPVKTGKFIAELRKAHNLTQDELGSIIFISRKSISKWETGKSCPSIDMLKKLSTTLGVSLDELLAGEFITPQTDEKHISKILHKREWKAKGIIATFIILLSVAVFSISNNRSPKVFSLSYEDGSFTIANGIMVLSKNEKFLNLGNFYYDLLDVDDNTQFDFLLYYMDDNEIKEIFHLNKIDICIIENDIYNSLLAVFNKNNDIDLHLKVSYKNVDGKEVNYDLKLLVTKAFKRNSDYVISRELSMEELSPTTGFSPLPDFHDFSETYYENKGIENINVEFLFELKEDEIEEKLDGRTINMNGRKYQISYSQDLRKLIFYCNNHSIYFLFKQNRIVFDDIETVSFAIIDDYNIYFDDTNIKYYDFVKSFIKELKNIIK